jgi:asparagine synthase (glutamine-hydrolysing)
MCGFIGALNKNKRLQQYPIEKIQLLLHHRGPDNASAIVVDDSLFVHNRLSIIDLSENANQPFISEETGNVLLFNGEIYNYQELKKKYASIIWRTNSDVEVIIKLYDALGPQFVEELNGIFAFSIYDKNNRRLMLCRDRVGVKPLYYHITRDALFFASEIKGILTFIDDYALDYQSLSKYIEYGLLSDDEHTFFNGIYAVLPGTYVHFDINTWKHQTLTYWDIGHVDLRYRTESDIYEETIYLLRDSIRLNLVSDVEIGLSLSSGLDSTLLFYLLKEQGAESLRSFTYGFKEQLYDEVYRVHQNNFLSPHDLHPVYLDSPEALEVLDEAIYFFEAPLGGLGTLSLYQMMKSVKNAGIKVMIGGEGADEVFGGYQYYYPAFFKDIEYDQKLLRGEVNAYNKSHGRYLIYGSDDYHYFLQSMKSNGVLAPDGTSLQSNYCSDALLSRINKSGQEQKTRRYLSALKSAMYEDLKFKKIPKLLFFQDRASMAHSVETRVPYLDHRLIELMYAVPPTLKIRNGQTKYLARKILREYFGVNLYSDVKHYVATPQREWLKEDLYDDVVELINGGCLDNLGLIKLDKFLSDYKAYRESKELGNSFFAWKMLNLELFIRKFFKDK